MSTLSPQEAAVLADAVYGIREVSKEAKSNDIVRGVKERLGGSFDQLNRNWDIAAASVAHGQSGLTSSKESGFAMVVPGINERRGQSAVLFRGTQTKSDWGTNFTLGGSNGPSGLLVHTGFNRVFNTLKGNLQSTLSKRLNGQIHVVGHSLGGALGNLMAAQLACGLDKKPKLYTFGAPRVGFNNFASVLEQRVGSKNIYRVYDIADPVPMIPIFPFVHSPRSINGIKVGVGGGAVNVPSHFMGNYMPRVNGLEWGALANNEAAGVNLRDIDGLLNIASQHVKIPGASMGLWALGKVLQALIDISFLVVSPATTIAFTAMDKLAQLLTHVAVVSKKIGSRIMQFMEMVFKWLGRSVAKPAIELTSAFLRYVLGLLITPIIMLARSAIDRFSS